MLKRCNGCEAEGSYCTASYKIFCLLSSKTRMLWSPLWELRYSNMVLFDVAVLSAVSFLVFVFFTLPLLMKILGVK